jgi:hypothetical protein
MTATTPEAPVTEGASLTATDGTDVAVDTWGNGTLTLTVDGVEMTMSLEAAHAALVVLGYGVAVGK